MKKVCSRGWSAAMMIEAWQWHRLHCRRRRKLKRQTTPVKIDMVVFGQPSLGAFLTPVIKQRKLDIKHGIDFNFVERTPDAYIAQFNSGEFSGPAAALRCCRWAWPANQGGEKYRIYSICSITFGAVVTDPRGHQDGERSARPSAGRLLRQTTNLRNVQMGGLESGR